MTAARRVIFRARDFDAGTRFILATRRLRDIGAHAGSHRVGRRGVRGQIRGEPGGHALVVVDVAALVGVGDRIDRKDFGEEQRVGGSVDDVRERDELAQIEADIAKVAIELYRFDGLSFNVRVSSFNSSKHLSENLFKY